MPNAYSSGKFVFTKVREGEGGAYYNITNAYCGGKTWDYSHWFTSTNEMDEYARTH